MIGKTYLVESFKTTKEGYMNVVNFDDSVSSKYGLCTNERC